MNRFAMFLTLTALAILPACAPPDDQRTGSVTADEWLEIRSELGPEGQAALDAGSEAYRAGDFEAALGHYEQAAELAPGAPAPWFGVFMSQKALGDEEAAAAALERVRSMAPGASLVRDSAGGGP